MHIRDMLNVFITIDVEIWCDGWDTIDENFPSAFRHYVYGPTNRGDCALPLTLSILRDHDLQASFFVEPLFSMRFGAEPLGEIVDLIQGAGQEIQLHLHTEWVDEAKVPLFPHSPQKRQFMANFSLEEQSTLVRMGLDLFSDLGVRDIRAFRAGGFGMSHDTFGALSANGIEIDCSYNHCQTFARDVVRDFVLHQPALIEGIHEYPMSVFEDFPGHLRHAQLGACSYHELEQLLRTALERDFESVVILSHGTELLNHAKTRPDPIAIKRFSKLCAFLHDNRQDFTARGFRGLRLQASTKQPAPTTSRGIYTIGRYAEQAWRRLYG